MKFSIYQNQDIDGVYIVKPKMPGFSLPGGENIIPVVNEQYLGLGINYSCHKYFIPRYHHLHKIIKPQRYVLGRMFDVRIKDIPKKFVIEVLRSLKSTITTTFDDWPNVWCNVPIYLPSTISKNSFSSRVKFIAEVEVGYSIGDYWEAELLHNYLYYDFIQYPPDPAGVMRGLNYRYRRWDIEMFRFYQRLYRKGIYK